MHFSDLWYDVFRVDFPTLQYEINVSLQKYVTKVEKKGRPGEEEEEVVGRHWKSISSFVLSPASPEGRTTDGTVSFIPSSALNLIHGFLYSLDWTTGLDYWTGLLD